MQPERALNAIDEYLRKDSTAYWAWTEKGRILMEMGRNAEGEATIRRSLELNAANSHAWNNLGVVLHRLGHLESSWRAYREAMRCDPLNVGAMTNGSMSLRELGYHDRATDLLCTALRAAPHKRTLRFNAGNLIGLMLQDRALEPAIRVAQALLSADPDNSLAWHNLGVAFAALGRRREAIECLDNALRCEPENVESQALMSDLKRRSH